MPGGLNPMGVLKKGVLSVVQSVQNKKKNKIKVCLPHLDSAPCRPDWDNLDDVIIRCNRMCTRPLVYRLNAEQFTGNRIRQSPALIHWWKTTTITTNNNGAVGLLAPPSEACMTPRGFATMSALVMEMITSQFKSVRYEM